MSKFDFLGLYAQYPAVIRQMPDVFDSHQFILELARLNQVEYVRALNAYLNPESDEKPEPFQVVHGILAKKLTEFPDLIVLIRRDKPSADIFGNNGQCAEWRKISLNQTMF
jgi:hypothetical protein